MTKSVNVQTAEILLKLQSESIATTNALSRIELSTEPVTRAAWLAVSTRARATIEFQGEVIRLLAEENMRFRDEVEKITNTLRNT